MTNRKLNTPLANALREQVQLKRHRFHVPFHAGRNLAHWPNMAKDALHALDLTELPPLDVLGNPQGVLRDSQAEVASLYKVRESFYLINGASTGIMAAMMASGLREDETVLLARNCHRSAVHALILTGHQPYWLLPEPVEDWGLWGAVSPEALEQTLAKHPEIGLFVMTHPTYEGVGSEIKAIAQICRQHQVKLIVDEAHGSLWPLFDELPASAVHVNGVDAVVHSLHKSAGSLTQTAVLHLPHGSRLSPEDIQQALNVLQTTSPSYVLLGNMETTLAHTDSPEGRQHITRWLEEIAAFRAWIKTTLETIRLLPYERGGGFHVFLASRKLTGEDFATRLEDTHDIAFEAATERGVLLMMNGGLSQGALTALQSALTEIDTQTRSKPDVTYPPTAFSLPKMAMSPRAAFYARGTQVPAPESVGRIAQQVVASCPPGIPVLIPGEVITHVHEPFLSAYVQVVE